MDISVVIPVYGVEKYVDKSLRSLFTQTKRDQVEFIIVNDCTKDSSMEIARKVAAEFSSLDIKFVDKPQNEGLAAARQTGIDIAKGEYIANIDSDDWCEANMLEELYEAAKSCNADIVIGDFWLTYPDNEVYLNQNITSDNAMTLKLMFGQTAYPSIWSKILKRQFLIDNDIKWIKGVDMGEDLVICAKLFSCDPKVAYVEKAFVHYVCNPASMTNAISEKSLKDMIEGIEIIESYIEKNPCKNELLNSLLIKKINNKAMAMARSNSYKEMCKLSNLYPETNKVIFSNNLLPLYHKMALFFASKKIYVVSKMIYSSIKAVKRANRTGR